MTDHARTMQDRLRLDLKAAMLARRTDEVRVLRSALAAVDNAQAVPAAQEETRPPSARFGDPSVEVPRLSLSADQLCALLNREIEARGSAAADMRRLGQHDRADLLDREAEILRAYL